MKKIIALLLAVITVLSLCACAPGGGGKEEAKGLQIGFARETIMPAGNKIGLGGYGNPETRVSNSFLDYLYATCVAFSDDAGNTVLLYHLDLISTREAVHTQIINAVSSATGLAADHILVASTHTHSAPATSYDIPGIDAYNLMLAEKCAAAAQAAIADLSPAELSYGRVTMEGMNFVRHYIQASGDYVGSNFGNWDASPLQEHADVGDPGMQFVKITRAAEDKKDILLMNWQAHPCFTDGSGSGTNLSADFIGACRDYVEKQTDCLFAYFTGAAGNQNAESKMSSEVHGMGNKEYGETLANAMIEQLDNLTPLEAGPIQTRQFAYESPINKEHCDKLVEAKEVAELLKTADKTVATNKAKEYGLSSVYHANSIINRSAMEGTTAVVINTVSIGDFSWVNAPYEMWASSALAIKEQTPFDMTFIITCSGSHVGYIPSKEAYEYGCYESHTSLLSPGTAEALVENFVSMLNDLHATATVPAAE